MFSLIITIISIALVTALALATIYYGGSAFKSGQLAATAARFVVEGQQLTAATQIYYVRTGAYPASLQALVDEGYLTAIPASASADLESPGAFAIANAGSGGTWTMPTSRSPVFIFSTAPNSDVCQQINLKARGDDGILSQIVQSLATQCYGSANLRVVVAVPGGTALADLAVTMGEGTLSALPTSTLDPVWKTPPTLGAAALAAGGTGGTPPAGPSFTLTSSLGQVDTMSRAFYQITSSAVVTVTNDSGQTLTNPQIVLSQTGPASAVTFHANTLYGNAYPECAGTPLASGATCEVNLNVGTMVEPGTFTASVGVTFTTPTGPVTKTALLSETLNAPASGFWWTNYDQDVAVGSLSEFNTAATPSTSSANAFYIVIHNPSASQAMTLGNLTFTGNPAFVTTHNCQSTLAPQAQCYMTVTNPALGIGTYSGQVSTTWTDAYVGTQTKTIPMTLTVQ